MNTKLFTDMLAYIKANPHLWDQDEWATCLAGLTVKLHAPESYSEYEADEEMFLVREKAQELLELTDQQAGYIFYFTRDLADFDAFLASDGGVPKPTFD